MDVRGDACKSDRDALNYTDEGYNERRDKCLYGVQTSAQKYNLHSQTTPTSS